VLEVAEPSGNSASRLSDSKPSHGQVMVEATGREWKRTEENGRERKGMEWKGMERKESSHVVLLYIKKRKSRERKNNRVLSYSLWSVFARLQQGETHVEYEKDSECFKRLPALLVSQSARWLLAQ
jgi:hypothetical protein